MRTTNISQSRINQQLRNLKKDKLSYLVAQPLENDLYNWHFTIQGPESTHFHQGLYHGQILLPYEYPFKPPDIIFMNKNGRFETNKKICLTITQYHPEQWNSAWTIRTMLEAVISLFNQNITGIGYEESTPEIRKFLAEQSQNFVCEKCGPIRNLLAPRAPYCHKIEQIQSMKVEEQRQTILKPIEYIKMPQPHPNIESQKQHQTLPRVSKKELKKDVETRRRKHRQPVAENTHLIRIRTNLFETLSVLQSVRWIPN